MAYRETKLRRAEALVSDTFRYNAGGEHTLAELLAPGFFPANLRLEVGTLGLLFGSDGVAWIYVKGHDGTAAKRPVLELIQGGVALALAPEPAPTPEAESLKPTRKAA